MILLVMMGVHGIVVLRHVIENDSRAGRCNIILVVWLGCGICGSSVG